MIKPSAYYFSPSALTIDLNTNTGQGGFTPSETCSVSVVAGAAVKVSNQLVTEAGRTLNLGYNAQLGYRQFTFTGYNTVFGYKPTLPPQYNYINAKICVYLRLDASNNGSTGELIFLPYEVDYDGRILDESFVEYDDIATETHTEGGVTYHTLVNTNSESESGFYYYYIHIGTISEPESGVRAWAEIIQSGQLETSKGNNEDNTGTWSKMFQLLNNVIHTLLPFDRIWFTTSDNSIERITSQETGFSEWLLNNTIATTKSIAAYIVEAISALDTKFFRKDQDDTDPFLATFGDVHVASGLERGEEESAGNMEVDGNASIGGDASVGGNTNIGGNTNVEGDASVGGNMGVKGWIKALVGYFSSLQSENYTGDSLSDTGYRLTSDDGNGASKLTVDKLYVRMKAVFEELQVKREKVTGGNQIFSCAANVINRTDYFDINGDLLGYTEIKAPWILRGIPTFLSRAMATLGVFSSKRFIRVKLPNTDDIDYIRCYFLAKDGDEDINNMWEVNDLARCQTFNLNHKVRETYIDGTTTQVGNVFWWRQVIDVSDTPVEIDGRLYHYFDVSMSDCAADSDLPAAWDDVSQWGNTTDPRRMNLRTIEVNGEGAPVDKWYRGIYTFDMSKCWWGGNPCKDKISAADGVEFYGPTFRFYQEYGIEKVAIDRGEWSDIANSRDDYSPHNSVRKCYYYDRVSHNGSLWLCTIAEAYHWVINNGTEQNPQWDYIANPTIGQIPLCKRVQNYTTQEPSDTATDWQKQVAKGESITKQSETYRYATNNTGVRPAASSSDWQTAKPTLQQGYWLYTETTITWSDNSTTVLYTDERNPNDGQAGQAVTIESQSVTYSKQTTGNLDPTTLTYGSYPSSLSKGDWLYSKTTVTYSDNTHTDSYGVSYIGTDGATGRGISTVVEEYAVNNDPDNAPASSAFSTTFPTTWGENNRYIWNREVITYTKGSPATETTTPRIKIIWTKDGKGIDSIVNRYLTNNVATGITKQNYKTYNGGNEWPTAITPTTESNPYLWNFEVITYTDGTSEMTDPHVIGHYGKDGEDGKDAQYIYLRGTGKNRDADRLVYVNSQTNQTQYRSGRGLVVNVFNRATLAKVADKWYDTYGGLVRGDNTSYPSSNENADAARAAFATYLNSLDDTVFVCITSYDAIGWSDDMVTALKKFGLGDMSYTTTGGVGGLRTPFALLGYKGLQEGYALWQLQGTDANDPYAEVSAYINNGVFGSSKNGADGSDGQNGWMITADPANVIISQNMVTTNTFTTAVVGFSVKKGNVAVAVSSISTPTSDHFNVTKNGSTGDAAKQVFVSSPKTYTPSGSSSAEYYTEGSFTVSVNVTDPDTGTTVSFNVTVLCYANLLGKWTQTIENGVETSISEKLSHEIFGDDVHTINQTGQYIRGWAENTSVLTESVAGGGKNLLLGTDNYTSPSAALMHKSKAVDGVIEYRPTSSTSIYSAYDLIAGKEYVLQCCADGILASAHDTTGTQQGKFTVWLRYYGDETHNFCFTSENYDKHEETVTGGKRYWWKFTPAISGTYYFRTNTYSDGATEITVNFWNIMLELGSTPSTWVAPKRDTTSSQIKQIASEIDLSIRSGLTRTGINITTGDIDMQADKFTLRNGKGEVTLGADANGNLDVRGKIHADWLYQGVNDIGGQLEYQSGEEYWRIAKGGSTVQRLICWKYVERTPGASIISRVVLPYPGDVNGKVVDIILSNSKRALYNAGGYNYPFVVLALTQDEEARETAYRAYYSGDEEMLEKIDTYGVDALECGIQNVGYLEYWDTSFGFLPELAQIDPSPSMFEFPDGVDIVAFTLSPALMMTGKKSISRIRLAATATKWLVTDIVNAEESTISGGSYIDDFFNSLDIYSQT